MGGDTSSNPRAARRSRTNAEAAPERSHRRVAAFAALAALLAGLVLVARGCFADPPAPAANAAPSAVPTVTADPAVAVAPVPAAPVGSGIDLLTMSKLTSVARLEQVLADYKADAVYPPWSRPHDEGTKYKLDWNKPSVSDLPFSDKPDRPSSYRFASDKAHVVWGDSLTSWIEAWEGDDDTKRIPLKITNAFVMAVGGPKAGRLVPLEYKDDGVNGDAKAGDLRYSCRLTPSEHPALNLSYQVQLNAVIEQGDARRLIVREFTYAPRPIVNVTGISDAIKDGNLVVQLAVDVLEKGVHTFEANILSGDGKTPVGWLKETRPLEAGKHVVELRFFGKLFHDKQVDGPYLIKDVRGFLRFLDPGAQETPIWWKWDQTHLTKPYKPVDLSPKEWDDPEKTEVIDRMNKLIADTKAGKIGQPTDKPKHIHIDENGKTVEMP